MAKKSKDAVEHVWLQCTECNELNYRTPINVKGGIAEKLKAGMKKYCPNEKCDKARSHTLHKIKRK